MAGVALRLVVLKTRQVERLREFYQVLGIPLTAEQHGQGPAHFAGAVGEVVLEIFPLPEGGTTDASTRLGFAVDDLHAVLEQLRAAGAAVSRPPQQTPWGYRAVVQDPDGRAVELYQRPRALDG